MTAQDGHSAEQQPSIVRVNIRKPGPSEGSERLSWKWGLKDEEQVSRHRGWVGPPGRGIKLQKGPKAGGREPECGCRAENVGHEVAEGGSFHHHCGPNPDGLIQ